MPVFFHLLVNTFAIIMERWLYTAAVLRMFHWGHCVSRLL